MPPSITSRLVGAALAEVTLLSTPGLCLTEAASMSSVRRAAEEHASAAGVAAGAATGVGDAGGHSPPVLGGAGANVTIRWAGHPDLCFDASHSANAGAGVPGRRLQVWGCAEDRSDWDAFAAPLFGDYGQIRPLGLPDLCLQTSDSREVSFRQCDELPLAQMLWLVDKGPDRVRLAADSTKCLGIPQSSPIGQSLVEVQMCEKALASGAAVDYPPGVAGSGGAQALLIEPALVTVPCVWGKWSDWTRCSHACDTQLRTRHRSQLEAAEHHEASCIGRQQQEGACRPCSSSTFLELVSRGHVDAGPFAWAGIGLLTLTFTCLSASWLLRPRQQLSSRLLGRADAMEESYDLVPAAVEPVASESQAKIATCPQRHRLLLVEQSGGWARRRWHCSGCRTAAGCQFGFAKSGRHTAGRHRCEECNFDLCTECYAVLMQRALDQPSLELVLPIFTL